MDAIFLAAFIFTSMTSWLTYRRLDQLDRTMAKLLADDIAAMVRREAKEKRRQAALDHLGSFGHPPHGALASMESPHQHDHHHHEGAGDR